MWPLMSVPALLFSVPFLLFALPRPGRLGDADSKGAGGGSGERYRDDSIPSPAGDDKQDALGTEESQSTMPQVRFCLFVVADFGCTARRSPRRLSGAKRAGAAEQAEPPVWVADGRA